MDVAGRQQAGEIRPPGHETRREPVPVREKGCLDAYASNFSIISQAAEILNQDRTN